ncbi:MAG: hypothetical protein Q9199_001327 [Rusavskia elegans]
MDSIRNAMSYRAQSGQEPLSGQTGRGTVDEPYDSGNLAGQSGAPSSMATSTNPAGTTQFDTGTDAQGNTIGYGPGTTQFDSGTDTKGNTSGFGAANDDTNTSQYPIGDNNTTTNTSETLAAGVTGDSNGPADAPADKQHVGTSIAGDTSRAAAGDTSGAAHKGTDETRGADEQVTSEQSRPTSDNNANAQDTFFANAGMSKDNKTADPPKVASEVADKDPFASSGGAPSSDPTNEPSGQSAAPSSSYTTPGAVGGNSFDNVSSTAPDKNYKTVDTEPHPQSSEVLSSATPGAALDSQPRSQTSGYDNTTTAATGASGYGNDSTPDTSASIHDNTTTTMGDRSRYGNEPTTTSSGYDNTPTTTTTAAAADTDYPSPKTQPTESAGGLAGVSHNTGSAPSAPDTGVSDSSLQQAASQAADEGGSHGEGKKKMSDKIKEKLHMGKK